MYGNIILTSLSAFLCQRVNKDIPISDEAISMEILGFQWCRFIPTVCWRVILTSRNVTSTDKYFINKHLNKTRQCEQLLNDIVDVRHRQQLQLLCAFSLTYNNFQMKQLAISNTQLQKRKKNGKHLFTMFRSHWLSYANSG